MKPASKAFGAVNRTGLRASTVPAGRTGYRAGFPGTSSLANIHCRFATLPRCDEYPAKSGRKEVGRRAKPGGNEVEGIKTARFGPLKGAIARLRPPSPTWIFWRGKRREENHRDTEARSQDGDAEGESLGRCGKRPYRALVRNYAGKITGCYGLFGFPSPPRDGCPKGVVRWRETWSRLFGFLRVGPIFRREFHE